MKYQQWRRKCGGKACHRHRAEAASRRPVNQATMRRLARSTASQSHTLRRRRPTNVYISSSSSSSHARRWAFFGRRRGKGGEACWAFFCCQFGHRHARDVGGPHDAALGIAFNQQLFHLRATGGPFGGRRPQVGLMATCFALVLGVALAAAVAPKPVTAAGGAQMLHINHEDQYVFHQRLDHQGLVRAVTARPALFQLPPYGAMRADAI